MTPEQPHVVFPGDTWGFGKPTRLPITPDTLFNPPSTIARIKVDETLMRSGLPVTVVHLPDFYGPGMDNALIRPLLEKALAGLVNAEARAAAGMMHTFAWDVTMDGIALQRDAGFVLQVGYERGHCSQHLRFSIEPGATPLVRPD